MHTLQTLKIVENAEKSMEKVQSQIASNVHNLSFMTFYMTLEKIYLWTT